MHYNYKHSYVLLPGRTPTVVPPVNTPRDIVFTDVQAGTVPGTSPVGGWTRSAMRQLTHGMCVHNWIPRPRDLRDLETRGPEGF